MTELTKTGLLRVTKEEFDAHVAEMKAQGLTGQAPRSRQPKTDVRKLVAEL
ncbi:hypothetical protein [Rhizobium leguminosarum]|uniref:hypothetical protein n=1 Tax=Rhizobium leguminosarum TaxID=384 RepID=UPI002E13FA97|nr:hypothetical protein U8Q02_37715 [Rhizobium leguminosarum]